MLLFYSIKTETNPTGCERSPEVYKQRRKGVSFNEHVAVAAFVSYGYPFQPFTELLLEMSCFPLQDCCIGWGYIAH